MRLAIALDGRARADVGNASQLPAIQLQADDEHPAQRRAAALELDIGGWRAELAAELLPVHHPSAQAERPTQ